MKKYLLVLIIGFAFMVGCKDHEAERKVAQLQKEKDSVISVANTKDASIYEFVKSYNEIEANLEEVKKHQNLITLNSNGNSEQRANVKERINDDIILINSLMDENKKKLADLTAKMNESDYKVGTLNQLVATLKGQITAKDAELLDLNSKLVAMNANVEELKSNVSDLKNTSELQAQTITVQSSTIDDQTNKLHTAYYAVGTYKELKDKNVVVKEGGILGVGSSEKMKKDFNEEYFTKVDITKVSEVPIDSKKAELISAHPAGSYEFEKNNKNVITKLVITNPDKFWEASKYLIVKVD